MSRKYLAEILDSTLTFEQRRDKVSEQSEECRDDRRRDQNGYIYRKMVGSGEQSVPELIPEAEHDRKDDRRYKSAEKALPSLFGADLRAELVSAEERSGEISPAVRYPCHYERHDNKENAVIRPCEAEERKGRYRKGYADRYERDQSELLEFDLLVPHECHAEQQDKEQESYRYRIAPQYIVAEEHGQQSRKKQTEHRYTAVSRIFSCRKHLKHCHYGQDIRRRRHNVR